jgi:hypothetical protein
MTIAASNGNGESPATNTTTNATFITSTYCFNAGLEVILGLEDLEEVGDEWMWQYSCQ